MLGSVHQRPDTVELHNGAAWSADGRNLMPYHSNEGVIHRHAHDPDAGRTGSARVFAGVANGLPDGAAMDEQGCYWCAIQGGDVLHSHDSEICAEGFDAGRGAFMQSSGSRHLDASVLLLPLVDFLPAMTSASPAPSPPSRMA